MPSLLPIEVDAHLAELVTAQHLDPVLDDMERRADAHGSTIVGRAVGRFLELQARMVGARRVVALGSGWGASAYWLARAVGPDGEVVCTDTDPGNAVLAEAYLRRAGLWPQVRPHVGDALDGLATVEGALDVVYCAIDPQRYPAAWESSRERLRPGGVFLCADVLRGGRVARGEKDDDTRAIVAMTREVAQDPRYVSAINPAADGTLVALRVA